MGGQGENQTCNQFDRLFLLWLTILKCISIPLWKDSCVKIVWFNSAGWNEHLLHNVKHSGGRVMIWTSLADVGPVTRIRAKQEVFI